MDDVTPKEPPNEAYTTPDSSLYTISFIIMKFTIVINELVTNANSNLFFDIFCC